MSAFPKNKNYKSLNWINWWVWQTSNSKICEFEGLCQMKNLKRLFNTRMHWAGGCVSQHALGREGVCVYPSINWGCVSQHALGREGVCPGGCLSRWRGCLSGGVCPGGCLPGRVWQTPPCGQNSWHTLVKTLPCLNFVAGGKNSFQIGNSRLSQPFVSLARNHVFPEHYCKNRKYATVL